METPNNSIKILVVGEAASIHTAKYVSMLQRAGYAVRLFSNSPNTFQDPLLKNTIIYRAMRLIEKPINGNIFKISILGATFTVNENPNRIYFRILKILNRYSGYKSAQRYLNRVISEWAPDVIVSLKMQNDGYVMSNARMDSSKKYPPWAHFIWGTDIEFFGKDSAHKEEHLPKIKKLLAQCDYLIADTYRDLDAAKSLGYKGIILGKQIAQGGFDMNFVFARNNKSFEDRKVIIVKGRHGGLIGKAMNTLNALHELKDHIRGYEIKFIMATPDIRHRALEYSRADNIFYDCVDRLDYSDLMDLFGRARIAISATDVDGTPGYLLESMAMGALPVHSDMASIREWITHEKNGLLFPVDDIEAQKNMIMRGLSDEALFKTAQEKNLEIAREEMDEKLIQKQTQDMISTMISGVQTQESKRAA